MDLTMTVEERDAFLSETRIAIICIEQPAGAPLAVPIWYGYDPSVGVWITTPDDSLKAKRLRAAGRFTLVVQDEDRPHRYVSVEGPIVDFRPVDPEKDIRPMAEAYEPDQVEMFIELSGQMPASIVVMKPEIWRTYDQTKMPKS